MTHAHKHAGQRQQAGSHRFNCHGDTGGRQRRHRHQRRYPESNAEPANVRAQSTGVCRTMKLYRS
eukprot:2575906-Pleurochrysis_carterae.AAC.1